MGKQSDNKLTETAAHKMLLSISANASYISVVEGEYGKKRLHELHKCVAKEFHGVKNTSQSKVKQMYDGADSSTYFKWIWTMADLGEAAMIRIIRPEFTGAAVIRQGDIPKATLHCAKMQSKAQMTGKQVWEKGKAIDRDLKIWYAYWQELLDKSTKKPPSGELMMTMF